MESIEELRIILTEFSDIILRYDPPQTELKKGKQSLRIVIYLKDGSLLRVYQSLVLLKLKIGYNYYWFKDDNTLIIGWDNADHHPEIETHPDHKHIGNRENVEPSEPMDLRKVLMFIAKIIGMFLLIGYTILRLGS